MKTKTLLLIPLLALAAISCNKEKVSQDRSETIEVYANLEDAQNPEAKPLDAVCVGVLGGRTELFVKTDVELKATWQDALTSPWAKIVSYEPTDVSGINRVTIEAKRISASAYYTRRSGTLLLSAPSIDFGKFIAVHQGSVARFSCNFASWYYGSTDPLEASGEKNISAWSDAQKNYKFATTPFAGGDVSYVFGKNGFIKLGDDKGHGADIYTPYADAMRADSLLMFSVLALAYQSRDGVKDSGHFTVEVTGGGVIKDYEHQGGTSIEFDAPFVDSSPEDYPASVWTGANFLVFVKSIPTNPITANTRIRVISGSLDKTTNLCSRLLVDNIYIRKLGEGFDEDYYTENDGSGPDKILGAPVIEEGGE